MKKLFDKTERKQMSQEEYFQQVQRYSASDLRALQNSVWDVQKQRQRGTPSPPMVLGSAFDTSLLEPHCFDNRFAILGAGVDTPTTPAQHAFCTHVLRFGPDTYQDAYREAYSAYSDAKALKMYEGFRDYLGVYSGDREVLTYDAHQNLKMMIESSRQHPLFDEIVLDGEPQCVYYGDDLWKGMADVIGRHNRVGGGYVLDVKTTADWGSIRRHFFGRGYDMQLRMYCALAEKEMAFIFYQESVPPFRNKLVDVTEYVEQATEKLEKALHELRWHIENDIWDMSYACANGGWDEL